MNRYVHYFFYSGNIITFLILIKTIIFLYCLVYDICIINDIAVHIVYETESDDGSTGAGSDGGNAGAEPNGASIGAEPGEGNAGAGPGGENNAVEPGEENKGDQSNSGNTFSTDNDDIAFCEHRSRNRIILADSSDFKDNPVPCTYCDRPALNGTEFQSAVVCEGCGATICETCNEPNADSDNDSGIGEE
jgi:hypothetical protein